jgi:hypothetical protein
MKKIVLLTISLFVISNNLQAQDLIVTNNGDSINCKITKITKEYVYFTFKHNAEIRNTLLPVNQIITQEKNYFSQSELPANYTQKSVFPHFRLAVDGGWQYRIPKLASGIDAEWQEHYRKLKSGFHYDVQAAYFFVENHGVEVLFSRQLFGHSLNRFLTDDDDNPIAFGKLNEKIAFNYIGANYVFRLFGSKNKNCFLFSIGLAYMGYNDRLFF